MDFVTFLREEADKMDYFDAPHEAGMYRGAADEIERLRAEAAETRRLSLELYTVTTGPAVARAKD